MMIIFNGRLRVESVPRRQLRRHGVRAVGVDAAFLSWAVINLMVLLKCLY